MTKSVPGFPIGAFLISPIFGKTKGTIWINYIPFSILFESGSLPYVFYDEEVYQYFVRTGEWVWYEVQADDSLGLSNIANKFYRDSRLWPEICVFNRTKLGTQSRCREEVLLVGMRLRIPVLSPTPALITTSEPTPTDTPTTAPPTSTATSTPTASSTPTPTATPLLTATP